MVETVLVSGHPPLASRILDVYVPLVDLNLALVESVVRRVVAVVLHVERSCRLSSRSRGLGLSRSRGLGLSRSRGLGLGRSRGCNRLHDNREAWLPEGFRQISTVHTVLAVTEVGHRKLSCAVLRSHRLDLVTILGGDLDAQLVAEEGVLATVSVHRVVRVTRARAVLRDCGLVTVEELNRSKSVLARSLTIKHNLRSCGYLRKANYELCRRSGTGFRNLNGCHRVLVGPYARVAGLTGGCIDVGRVGRLDLDDLHARVVSIVEVLRAVVCDWEVHLSGARSHTCKVVGAILVGGHPPLAGRILDVDIATVDLQLTLVESVVRLVVAVELYVQRGGRLWFGNVEANDFRVVVGCTVRVGTVQLRHVVVVAAVL